MRRRMVGGLIPRAMSFGDFRMGLISAVMSLQRRRFCFFLRRDSARDGGEQDGAS